MANTKGVFTERTLKKVERILNGLSSGKYDYLCTACKSEGLSRTVFYDWRNTSADNKKKLYEVLDGARVVEAEDSLFELVRKGNVTALIFFLCNRVPYRWRRHDLPPPEIERPDRLPIHIVLDPTEDCGECVSK